MSYSRRDEAVLPMGDEGTVALPQCPSGKRCYRRKKDAVTVMNHRLRNGAEYLRVYSCARCGCHHVTKEPPR